LRMSQGLTDMVRDHLLYDGRAYLNYNY